MSGRIHLPGEEPDPLRFPTRRPPASVAILLYLNRENDTEDHWYPEDWQARARVDEFLSWQHLAIHDLCSKILWLKVLFPYFTDKPVMQDKLDDALEELKANLQQLEEKFLQDQPFIAGDHVSLADLVAVVELMQPVGAGCPVFEERPKLSEWRELVEEAVGKELFREAHDKILKVQELSGQQADPLLKEKMTAILKKMM
ncbi:glutathione S-transferase theta-1-like isoform X2 [Tachyglossus aculeatus]|uniref:glutathione S-transferase theta-1-like isoform X2 n=1 Tax=Tachyglossus aculeatus TaxID=9261 RepID=UPI0018F433DD|nr:glutathione S-transferase theta-1-like isoform X2 [Tachyglossus aculeatus]XP_038619220.1 glutathione S-transferase theta-1-like isoform X2 [Tachyglossus aculeatus]